MEPVPEAEHNPRSNLRLCFTLLLATRVLLLVSLVVMAGVARSAHEIEPVMDSWIMPGPHSIPIEEPRLDDSWRLPAPEAAETWALQATEAAEAAAKLAREARGDATALSWEPTRGRSKYLAQLAHRGAEDVAATAARALRAALIARSGIASKHPHWARWSAEEAQTELRRAHRGRIEVSQLAFEARVLLATSQR